VNGPSHWSEADKILTVDDRCEYGCPHSGCVHEMAMIGRAIAHGLLAVAAATAGGLGDVFDVSSSAEQWREVTR
jgi:hypothetical protein